MGSGGALEHLGTMGEKVGEEKGIWARSMEEAGGSLLAG